MTLASLLDHRLIVCVGTGGVGKTTIAAAIALGAAMHGRRAMTLAIDPARALARALGMAALSSGDEPIDLVARAGFRVAGAFAAAMLDQKAAWDAFVTRHAPSPEIARTLLASSFYQRLSTSFAGSTEYVAIEEMCRLAESGRHDLVVLDTPPSAHALDLLRAPDRIDRLLDERSTLEIALRSTGGLVRFVVRQLERAVGSATLHDLAAFLDALAIRPRDGCTRDGTPRSPRPMPRPRSSSRSSPPCRPSSRARACRRPRTTSIRSPISRR